LTGGTTLVAVGRDGAEFGRWDVAVNSDRICSVRAADGIGERAGRTMLDEECRVGDDDLRKEDRGGIGARDGHSARQTEDGRVEEETGNDSEAEPVLQIVSVGRCCNFCAPIFSLPLSYFTRFRLTFGRFNEHVRLGSNRIRRSSRFDTGYEEVVQSNTTDCINTGDSPQRFGGSQQAVQTVHAVVERHDDRLFDEPSLPNDAHSGHVD